MADHNCKYHPTVAARWTCADCGVEFCNQCVTKDSIKNTASCPLCKAAIEQVEARNFIVPFWERMPAFFKYPLNTGTLVMIGGISLFVSAAMFMGMFAWIFLAFTGLAFLRYLMAVVHETANGRFKPVNFSLDLLNDGFSLPLKLLAIILGVISLTVYLALNLQFTAVRVVQITFMLILPAQIMILATEESLARAINPLYLADTIRRIPLAYVGLLIFLMLLSVSSEYVQWYIARQRSLALYPVMLSVSMYFTVVMFNLMGYVVFQYHEELDYPVRLDVDDDDVSGSRPKAQTPVNPELVGIEVLVKEDRIDDAISELTRLINQNPLNSDMNDYLFRLLKTHNRGAQLVRFADHYVNVLFNQGDKTKAASVCLDVLTLDSNFKLANPDVYLDLVKLFKARMAGKQGVTLCAGFHKRFPEHHAIPELYFTVAQILAESLNNDEQAMQVLSYVAQNYPDDEIIPQVRQYQVVLHKMRNSA